MSHTSQGISLNLVSSFSLLRYTSYDSMYISWVIHLKESINILYMCVCVFSEMYSSHWLHIKASHWTCSLMYFNMCVPWDGFSISQHVSGNTRVCSLRWIHRIDDISGISLNLFSSFSFLRYKYTSFLYMCEYHVHMSLKCIIKLSNFLQKKTKKKQT